MNVKNDLLNIKERFTKSKMYVRGYMILYCICVC